MKIPLKRDWDSKVFEKAKVYLLNNRDKKLVDKTINKLY